jgi:dimethylaniline monooxygenase (N-oxide forming)
MKLAVIGAGPAGLTSAKQALQRSHEVVVFEKHGKIGGIWNPDSGRAYESVRMQSSKMSFHFSDFPARNIGDFPKLLEVHSYLEDYAEVFGVRRNIRFNSAVTSIEKCGLHWHITATDGKDVYVEAADYVIVASGELWCSKLPGFVPIGGRCPKIVSAKDYRNAECYRGQRVLVVGGGVSGADIASELVGRADSIDWSVRQRGLFLPRDCGGYYNDQLFSYIGRLGVHEMDAEQYIDFLRGLLPDYMRMYDETGLLPNNTPNNAIHVNENIIPNVHHGKVAVRSAYRNICDDGLVVFADCSTGRYDVVIFCTGYEMPDYGFIKGFRHEDLFEHFFYAKDPTLAIVNTPVDAYAFGTACPYFEAIAGWVLTVFEGGRKLPESRAIAAWCSNNMSNLNRKRFYDCWLETIRIGIISGQVPDPRSRFDDYWTVVSSAVSPSNLCENQISFRAAAFDALVDLPRLKARVLASVPRRARSQALGTGKISRDDFDAAGKVPSVQVISADLMPSALPVEKVSDLVTIQTA